MVQRTRLVGQLFSDDCLMIASQSKFSYKMLGLQLILGNVACILLADYRWRRLEGVIHPASGGEVARLFA